VKWITAGFCFIRSTPSTDQGRLCSPSALYLYRIHSLHPPGRDGQLPWYSTKQALQFSYRLAVCCGFALLLSLVYVRVCRQCVFLFVVIYNCLFKHALSCSFLKSSNHEMIGESVTGKKLHNPNSIGPGICLEGTRNPVQHSVTAARDLNVFETEISWTKCRRFSISTATSITVVLSRIVWFCTSFTVWTKARAYQVEILLREEKEMLHVRSVWEHVCLTVRASSSVLRKIYTYRLLCLGCLKMKALRSFKMSVTTNPATRRHIPEYHSSARLLISHS